MIVLAVALDQFGFEIVADFGEDALQISNGQFRKHVSAIFGYKDQMGVQRIDDVPSLANIRIISHSFSP